MADASLAPAEKTYIKCHQKKSIENFCKKANNKDGHDNRCRDCKKARYHERIEDVLRNKKEYYEKNREKILADKVIYQQEHREERINYSKQYYLANRETFLANRRKYYEENKESCLEIGRRWNLENKDHVSARNKRYRKENHDRIVAMMREYYKNNREYLLADKRRYYEDNRETILQKEKERWKNLPREVKKAIHRNCKAKRKLSEGSHTAAQIKELLFKQKAKCANCKTSIRKGYHADHIIPLVRNGSNYIENIQLLCPTCNLRKHARCPFEWANMNGKLL